MERDDPKDPPKDPPKDLDELRIRMARRLADHMQGWRRCTRPPCRRARRCVATQLACTAAWPDRAQDRAMTGDDRAQAMAALYAMVQERLAREERA